MAKECSNFKNENEKTSSRFSKFIAVLASALCFFIASDNKLSEQQGENTATSAPEVTIHQQQLPLLEADGTFSGHLTEVKIKNKENNETLLFGVTNQHLLGFLKGYLKDTDQWSAIISPYNLIQNPFAKKEILDLAIVFKHSGIENEDPEKKREKALESFLEILPVETNQEFADLYPPGTQVWLYTGKTDTYPTTHNSIDPTTHNSIDTGIDNSIDTGNSINKDPRNQWRLSKARIVHVDPKSGVFFYTLPEEAPTSGTSGSQIHYLDGRNTQKNRNSQGNQNYNQPDFSTLIALHSGSIPILDSKIYKKILDYFTPEKFLEKVSIIKEKKVPIFTHEEYRQIEPRVIDVVMVLLYIYLSKPLEVQESILSILNEAYVNPNAYQKLRGLVLSFYAVPVLKKDIEEYTQALRTCPSPKETNSYQGGDSWYRGSNSWYQENYASAETLLKKIEKNIEEKYPGYPYWPNYVFNRKQTENFLSFAESVLGILQNHVTGENNLPNLGYGVMWTKQNLRDLSPKPDSFSESNPKN